MPRVTSNIVDGVDRAATCSAATGALSHSVVPVSNGTSAAAVSPKLSATQNGIVMSVAPIKYKN